ncbi:UNVERIFIED_CONTAM: hypothetical protein GTU68_027247 [Idotea baltica]|nr:hypothetical protein [Idotea baltica]
MSSESENLHLAIIMDGNGRWATARGFERLKGHKRGVERVREVVEACPDLGVNHLTLFAFSTENWKRSEKEVSGLMALFRRYIRSEAARLFNEGVRVRFIGRRGELDIRLQDLMAGLEAQTAQNTRLHMTVAINYGGRDEIVRATQKVAALVASGDLDADEITEDVISAHMDTADICDPDLVLRTSGEFRTSNFLPWQSVYAEYVFEESAWPDFTIELLAQTVTEFRSRDRRFGAVGTK